jgi:hypothetical protein
VDRDKLIKKRKGKATEVEAVVSTKKQNPT